MKVLETHTHTIKKRGSAIIIQRRVLNHVTISHINLIKSQSVRRKISVSRKEIVCWQRHQNKGSIGIRFYNVLALKFSHVSWSNILLCRICRVSNDTAINIRHRSVSVHDDFGTRVSDIHGSRKHNTGNCHVFKLIADIDKSGERWRNSKRLLSSGGVKRKTSNLRFLVGDIISILCGVGGCHSNALTHIVRRVANLTNTVVCFSVLACWRTFTHSGDLSNNLINGSGFHSFKFNQTVTISISRSVCALSLKFISEIHFETHANFSEFASVINLGIEKVHKITKTDHDGGFNIARDNSAFLIEFLENREFLVTHSISHRICA